MAFTGNENAIVAVNLNLSRQHNKTWMHIYKSHERFGREYFLQNTTGELRPMLVTVNTTSFHFDRHRIDANAEPLIQRSERLVD